MTGYAQLLDRMADGTLDAGRFGHVDHIGVAYEALRRFSYFEALATVAKGIDDAAKRAGATDKFNATVTAAYMSLIAERMDERHYDNARDFIDRNPDLTGGAPLRALYSPARLASGRARRLALLPDLPA